jgi:hypothetical protein
MPMSQPERIEIPLSRWKLLKLLAFSLAFVAAGYFMFTADSAWIEQQRRFNNPLLVHAIGLAGFVMGALGCCAALFKCFSSDPGILIDARGITDMSSFRSHGHIPWNEITGFMEGAVGRQRFVYVLLRDPEAYIARFGPVRRLLLRMTARMGPSPVALTNVALKGSFDELQDLLMRSLARHEEGAPWPST